MKKFFGNFANRISSRKFIFFLIATYAMFTDRATFTEWIYCGIIFIGGKAAEKALDTYKAIKTMSNEKLAQTIKED